MVTTKINNMKTAMQELIEYLEKVYYVKEIRDWDEYKNKALEKEKEQIIDAYENGVGDENERNLSGNFTNAEQYYNQTYNQNK
jgi:hypothetical protein